jgi:hypothetical protein
LRRIARDLHRILPAEGLSGGLYPLIPAQAGIQKDVAVCKSGYSRE